MQDPAELDVICLSNGGHTSHRLFFTVLVFSEKSYSGFRTGRQQQA